jgi:hypothetical protein
MSHPLYSESYLQSIPLPRLKEIAKQLGTKPVVDARFKKTWVLVILRKQARTVELVENLVELLAIDPQPIESIEPADKPMELPIEQPTEPADKPMDISIDKPIEKIVIKPIDVSQPLAPMLIPILVIALVLLMSNAKRAEAVAIVPILVVSSIALVLGHPHKAHPAPQSIGSTS